MKNKLNTRFSTVAAAVLMAAVAFLAVPRMQAQTATPAQVLNQLLSGVEEDLVPLVEAMPADKFNFAPTNGNFKGVSTFAEQVKHVIHANYYLYGEASGMPTTNMPDVKTLKTKAEMVKALKDSFVFAHRSIDTLNSQNALERMKPVEGVDTRAGLMIFAIIHMNDHFGQLVEYARMNGIVPPSSRPPAK